ncbi:hypothetical protein KKA15_03485 [Patescibacteria group bacterium]|nr:hypothetical protein [Patescibacteria group bacterium]
MDEKEKIELPPAHIILMTEIRTSLCLLGEMVQNDLEKLKPPILKATHQDVGEWVSAILLTQQELAKLRTNAKNLMAMKLPDDVIPALHEKVRLLNLSGVPGVHGKMLDVDEQDKFKCLTDLEANLNKRMEKIEAKED